MQVQKGRPGKSLRFVVIFPDDLNIACWLGGCFPGGEDQELVVDSEDPDVPDFEMDGGRDD